MEYKPPVNPEKIRPHYSKTLRDEKVFLTAHSHMMWPDLIENAQLESVNLAFKELDHKWNTIFKKVIPEFQKLIASRIGTDKPDHIANAENTHELVTRVMSCFPWNSSTKFVSTDAEYFSLKRQLYRLEEEGVVVEYVSTEDKASFTERFIEAITPGTTAVFFSSVFFKDGYVVQNIPAIIEKARSVGAVVVIDVYHHSNIRKLNADALGRDIFIVGGGYKYASGGEGAAWLKIPESCNLRPKITGWFADFNALESEKYAKPVVYGSGASRFLGATRDVSGLFRQIAVMKFMDEMGMDVSKLEENNLYQTGYMIRLFDELKLESLGVKLLSSRDADQRGPFIALDFASTERASEVCKKLWDTYKILTDTRGSVLRIGTAPYTTQKEIDFAFASLKEILS